MSDALVQRAYEAAFRAWSRSAVYQPAQGEARAVRVMLRAADAGYDPVGIAVRAENPVAEFLVSEVPALATGDVLTIEGASFRLLTPRHADDRRLKWQAELVRL